MEKIIYAVIASNQGSSGLLEIVKNIRGISDKAIYTLIYKEIAIVVSDFSPSEFKINKELALDFARVIDELTQKLTLLPIRFGTFLESEAKLTQLLTDHYNTFLSNLQHVENKFEFGLKVLWDYAKCSEEIRLKTESEEVKAEYYFSKETTNTNYLLDKIKKHRLEDAILKHVELLIEETCCHLEQLNPDCKFKKMVTNSLILDAVFLVEKDKKIEFIKAIEELKGQHSELNFLLTGPWPPYNFIESAINE